MMKMHFPGESLKVGKREAHLTTMMTKKKAKTLVPAHSLLLPFDYGAGGLLVVNWARGEPVEPVGGYDPRICWIESRRRRARARARGVTLKTVDFFT